MKTIRTKQPKAHFTYFVQRDHRGIIAKQFTTQKKFHLNVTF